MFKSQLSVKIILISMILLMVFNKIYSSLHTSYVFCVLAICFMFIYLLICASMRGMRQGGYMVQWCSFRGQRSTFRSWMSPSTMWSQGSRAHCQASRETPLPTDHLTSPSFYLSSLKINIL